MQLDYWEAATQGFLPALAHAAQTANRLGDQVRIERYRKMQMALHRPVAIRRPSLWLRWGLLRRPPLAAARSAMGEYHDR